MQNGDQKPFRNSPEALAYRFIQACLRVRVDIEQAFKISTQPNFYWQTFLDVASTERLSSLLFHTLKGQFTLPTRVELALEEAYSYTARRNILLFHELDFVLKSLADIGVEAVLLKGAALAETVYGNIALRPMADLDLLVRHERIDEAIQTIIAIGYKLDERTNLTGDLEFDNEVQLRKKSIEDIGLDLHWNLLGWHYYVKTIPQEWFWQSIQPIKINDANGYTLGAEALLLHTCAHAVIGHGVGKGSLLWLVDIKEVICHYNEAFDWDLVLHMAQKSSLILPLQRSLPWVATRLDAPVPEEVLERCLVMEASRAEVKALDLRSIRSPAMAQRFLSDFESIPRWSDRFRYLYFFVFKKLLAPSENLIDRYQIRHRVLLPLYYPYWLIDGFSQLIRLIFESRKANDLHSK